MAQNHFQVLPFELKESILSYLNAMDVHFLSEVYVEFKGVLNSQRLRTLDFSTDFRLDHKIASDIFKPCQRLLNITYLNLNGIYWIDAGELRKFIHRLKNLETAFLLGTKLGVGKTDLKLYNSLKKLRHLAISKTIPGSHPVTFDGFYSTDIINYNDHCIGTLNWSKAKNMGLYKIFLVALAHPVEAKIYPINSMSWMDQVLKLLWEKDDKSVIEEYNRRELRTEIKYVDITGDKEENTLEQICKNNYKTKEFVLRCNNICSISAVHKIDLKPITTLKNLNKLHLDLYGAFSSTILCDIFTECVQLKSLKIITGIPQFNLAYLQCATKLEEICFITCGNFQIDKFFIDLLENNKLQMKRISIKFWHFGKFSMQPINTFLQNNPQLIFLLINCEISETTRQNIQKSLNTYIKSPKQIFSMTNFKRNSTSILEHVPPVHYDMMDSYYYIPGDIM